MPVKESDIEKYLVDSLKPLGCVQRKLKWIGRRSAPDRVIFYHGRTYLVEVKRPGGKPRLEQVREHNLLRAQGIDVTIIDTKEGVDEFAKRIINEGGAFRRRVVDTGIDGGIEPLS